MAFATLEMISFHPMVLSLSNLTPRLKTSQPNHIKRNFGELTILDVGKDGIED
jgi:hypothetical protein